MDARGLPGQGEEILLSLDYEAAIEMEVALMRAEGNAPSPESAHGAHRLRLEVSQAIQKKWPGA